MQHVPLESMFDTLAMYETLARVALWTFAAVGLFVWTGALAYLTGQAVRWFRLLAAK